MSYIGQQTNQQSLNGIIDLTDGTVIIQDGVISNVKSLSLLGEIDMNTNKIINLNDGVNAGDAVNKSQLDAVSVNLIDYVRRDGTNSMLGNLNLNSYKVTNLATGTLNGDAVNKLQMDSSLNLLRGYVDTQDTNLKAYTDSSLNSLKAYTDSSLNLLRDYVNTQGIADRSYIDASLNLKVNKSGDSMSDFLQLPEVRLTSQTTSYNSGTIDSSNRTNTYAVFEPAGTGTDWAFLRQIGGDNDIHLSLDFHDDNNDGKFSLRNVVSTNAPDLVKPFFTSTPTGTGIFNPNNSTTNITKHLNLETNSNGIWFNPYFSSGSYNPLVSAGGKAMMFSNGTKETGDLVIGPWSDYKKGIQLNSNGNVFINKNATYFTYTSTTLSSVGTTTLQTGSTIYDFYNVDATNVFKLPPQGSTDSFMVGKTISFNINQTYITAINLENNGGTNILINGTTYTNFSTTTSFKLVGTSTIGVYTTTAYIAPPVGDATDQLVINSNIGNDYTEFTGIKFSNTNTDAGLIRVETDIAHTNSNMRFYTRNSNAIILPLEIGNTIYAYRPIIRNQWSSGELIQTKIYNQTTDGSGVLTVNAGNGSNSISLWKDLSFTMLNNTTDSNVYVEVSALFHLSGYGGDVVYIQLRDYTNNQEDEFGFSTAYYNDNNGGGYRSGSLLPYASSYTPSTNTSNKTRSIQIRFNNLSNDTLSICKYKDANNNLNNKDLWTVRISEYKK